MLLTSAPSREMSADSPAALLAAVAPVVSGLHPLPEQLEYAARLRRTGQYDEVAASLSSAPGEFHRRMRSVVYRRLGLGEPAWPPVVAPPVPPSPLEEWEVRAGRGVAG